MDQDDFPSRSQRDPVNIGPAAEPAGGPLRGKLVGSSLLLFLDYLLVAVGGWLFWIVISRLASVDDVGIATTIYSLVITVATITQLGAEYPLLKKSHLNRSIILGTGMVIQVAISLATIPIIILAIDNMYEGALQEFTWIAIVSVTLIAVEFVARYVLLGIFDAKKVLAIDMVGLSVKFLVGYSLVSMQYGALGILLAFLSELFIIAIAYLIAAKNTFAFSIGKILFFKEILRDSLVNAPSKWSNMIIVNLSVVLLAAIGVNQGDIGIFYITLMISIVVGSFSLSMAFMVIPAFSASKKELTADSLRISLSIITPAITAMLIAPNLVLSLINSRYEVGAPLLSILAIGTIPFAITVNAITRLNNLKESKKLISIGILQLAVFLLLFFLVAPILGTMGAAFAILFAFSASATLSMIWSVRSSLKPTAFCLLSILVGFVSGFGVYQIADEASVMQPQILAVLTSTATSIAVIFASGNLSLREFRFLIKATFQENRPSKSH
jgi:O-antigen/teichoic acid export membrane protein